MPRWSHWRAASLLPDLTIRLDHLPPETGGGVLARRGDKVVIILDRRLTQIERRVMLAHELVHHERGSSSRCHDTGYLSPHVIHEERSVERIAAQRLVPADMLEVFVDRHTSLGHGVLAHQVADEFRVTDPVAALAMKLLEMERARRAS